MWQRTAEYLLTAFIFYNVGRNIQIDKQQKDLKNKDKEIQRYQEYINIYKN